MANFLAQKNNHENSKNPRRNPACPETNVNTKKTMKEIVFTRRSHRAF